MTIAPQINYELSPHATPRSHLVNGARLVAVGRCQQCHNGTKKLQKNVADNGTLFTHPCMAELILADGRLTLNQLLYDMSLHITSQKR